jgi:hypothetical protein
MQWPVSCRSKVHKQWIWIAMDATRRAGAWARRSIPQACSITMPRAGAFAVLVRDLECVIEWEMDFLCDTSDPPVDLGQLLEGQWRLDASLVLPLVWLDVRPP